MFKALRRGRIATALLLAFVSSAAARDFQAGDLRIDQPWSRATAPAAKVGAGYLAITNGGGVADRLVAASTQAAARVEIHEMRMDGGVMRMRELPQGLALPPGETVALKPGGYHLMFIDLRAPLTAGRSIPVTLVFERAGRVEIELSVEPATTRTPRPETPAAPHAH